jgi:hypothetical protein
MLSILFEMVLKLFTDEAAEEELYAVGEVTSNESCMVGFALNALYLR